MGTLRKGGKTNAIRYLETIGIPHETLEYAMDGGDLSAQHVSRVSHIPLDMLYKTIVCRGDKTGVVFACIPGDAEVDMKKLARVSGNKKVESVPLKEILPLTGYIRGGVSPIGCKKDYPLYIDDTAMAKEKISISAGTKGCQIIMKPHDLVNIRKAAVVAIAKS
ncbi:MAG: Cys-tRNA(Pro) deacylase [Firmicutes bacterium]|nr:Cys-tRNA(Pro) deacylase [Bacillota bacterium]